MCASGLLNETTGGPSVYPPQPAGVADLAYGATAWPTSEGADRYRRGLYTYQKRTSPYAAFVTFDGPSGESCVARRDRSNTPLQALTLLNDAVFVEAAQALARAAVSSGAATPRDRAEWIFRRCLTRRPTADELDDLLGFYRTQAARIDAGELDGSKIAGSETPASELRELAAWTLVARVIMNLDEFITKQ